MLHLVREWCVVYDSRRVTRRVKLSSLLTVKTLTGMTTDVYPRENCIAPAMVFIVWTTDTTN